MSRKWFALGLTLVLVGCADDQVAAPTGDQRAFAKQNASTKLTVMTRNMYVGADVDPIISASPEQVPFVVAQAWATLLRTNYPVRASMLADEILKTQPHLIGLQEVSLIRTQTPSDIVVAPGETPNYAPNATTVAFDFLPTLLAELAARGLSYTVASIIENTDVEVPRFDGVVGGNPTFSDVRLTDFDAILVRDGVQWGSPESAKYGTALPVSLLITIYRGWTSIVVTLDGAEHRFVNTHLESGNHQVRYAQAAELAYGVLGDEGRPVILVGDLNSGPGRAVETGENPAYLVFTGAGFTDLWGTSQKTAKAGYTCCNAADLSNTKPSHTQRIDWILWRRTQTGSSWKTLLVGDGPGDFGRNRLWPSDHAGVVAEITFPAVLW